jgi:hypothetical protein
VTTKTLAHYIQTSVIIVKNQDLMNKSLSLMYKNQSVSSATQIDGNAAHANITTFILASSVLSANYQKRILK